MPNYIKPLRRKIGVLTLVIACVFMGAWIRSLSVEDTRFITGVPDGACEYYVSANGLLGWMKVNRFARIEEPEPTRELKFTDLFGFPVSQEFTEKRNVTSLTVVPYWSIVIPLTLMSSWLLISKPRPPRTGLTLS